VRRIVSFLAAVVVAGCAAPPAPPPVQPPEPAIAPPQVAALPPPVIPRFEVGPAAPEPHPRGLMGVEDRAVVLLLGEPAVRRRDIGAQLWTYRGDNCSLQLFYYPEGSPERYFVRHFETRSTARARVTPEHCFAGLLRAAPSARR
jgi:hypothetical protein